MKAIVGTIIEKARKVIPYVVLSLILGLILTVYYYKDRAESAEDKNQGITQLITKNHNLKEVDVAINQFGEMMIVNRKTGEIHVFNKEFGTTIFRLYAANLTK